MEVDIIEETQFSVKNSEDETQIIQPNKDESSLKFYAQRLKVAVAIAVIRSTPSEMTPEEYATYLIQRIKDDSCNWKDKCEALEKELVLVTQKLETIAMKEKCNVDDMDITLPSIEYPTCLAVKPYMPPSADLRSKLSSTIEFVRSFIFLSSVPQENVRRPVECANLKETMLKSIALLFEYLQSCEGLSLEFEVVKCCIDEVQRLFDSKAMFFEKDLVELSMIFIENLLRDIYHTLKINMVDQQHRRSTLIQMLAEQKKLTPMILNRLLREITIISDGLTAIFKYEINDFRSLLKVENAYYVLQATEGTLHIMGQQKSALNSLKIPKELLAEWNRTTDKSLTDIATFFPMYSIYIWHIKTLMQSVLQI